MSVGPVLLDQLHQTLSEARRGATNGESVVRLAADSKDLEYETYGRVIAVVVASVRGVGQAVLDDADLAIQYFEGQAAPDPYFHWAAVTARGIAHVRMGAAQLAIEDYTQAFEIAQESGLDELAALTSINIGYVQRFVGDPISAMTALLQGVASPDATKETQALGHYFIAQIYADHAYWCRANEHGRRAIGLTGPFAGVRLRSLFAANLVQEGDLEEARSVLDGIELRSLNSETSFLWAHYLVAHGHLLVSEQKPRQAIAAFVEALRDIPDCFGLDPYVLAKQGLARAHLALHDPAEAIRVLDETPVEPLFLIQRRRHLDLYIAAYETLGDWQKVSYYEDTMLRMVIDRRVSLATLAKLTQSMRNGEQAAFRHRQLRLKSIELRRLKQDRDELIEIVANDLQSPLTTLELAMGMLGENTSPEVSKRCISWSNTAIHRIGGIATRLGLVTTLESGQWQPTSSHVELSRFIRERVTAATDLAAEKSISLEADLPDVIIRTELDLAALKFIVDQLIQNAITFTRPGGQVRVHLSDGGRAAVISVSDDGQGWHSEEQSRLFNKHSRLSSAPTGSEAASGLGLYIARELATLLGGSISAHSQGRDEGSVFTVITPLPDRQFGAPVDNNRSATY